MSALRWDDWEAHEGLWRPPRQPRRLRLVRPVLASIALRSVGAVAQNNAGASSLVVNTPAGVVDGDYMALLVAQNNTTTTLSALSGWSDVPGPAWPVSDSNSRMWARYRIASSEPASYTLSWGAGTPKSIAAIIAYSGVDTTTPHDANAVATNETNATGTTHSTPSLTTVTDQAWLLSFFADRGGTGNTWTPPSGDTERVDASVTGTSQCSCEINDTNGGVAVGSYSKTATPATWLADATMALIALRPAAAGWVPTVISQYMGVF